MAKKDDSTEAAPATAAAPADRPAYPKMRYKKAEKRDESIKTAITVNDEKAEADAQKDGYTFDVPQGDL